jgi:hypothetical protein
MNHRLLVFATVFPLAISACAGPSSRKRVPPVAPTTPPAVTKSHGPVPVATTLPGQPYPGVVNPTPGAGITYRAPGAKTKPVPPVRPRRR